MNTTRARRKMIDDAKAKGYTVIESESNVQIWTGSDDGDVGITLWFDGVSTRADIDLRYATAIRTVKAMRQLLNLPEGGNEK